MKTKSISLSILIMVLISGCATTTTGPMPAGKNTYVMSRQEGAFPSGSEPLMAEVLAEANIFCSNQDKEIKLINATENPGPYILGNYPKATITFSCIEPNSNK
tara:strand:+ start:1096 stop:1404 length:309 start_codon:yes stop_codon:yes gene_type:complete